MNKGKCKGVEETKKNQALSKIHVHFTCK